MTILIECKCGMKVEMDFTKTIINRPHEGCDILIGEQKCPHPDCDRTIYVNANITAAHTGKENWVDTKVNWDEAKIGDIIYHDRCPYEIALKSIRYLSPQFSTRVLYLRSKSGDWNLVSEVTEDGIILILAGDENPLTPEGYETWEEERVRAIFNRLNSKESFIWK